MTPGCSGCAIRVAVDRTEEAAADLGLRVAPGISSARRAEALLGPRVVDAVAHQLEVLLVDRDGLLLERESLVLERVLVLLQVRAASRSAGRSDSTSERLKFE